MLPKIIFRRSKLYDQILRRKRGFTIPDDRVFNKFIRRLKKQWAKFGSKILKEIAQVTKLKWHEKEIVCYVSAGVIPYSDPLTLSLQSNIHALTHELIHRLLSEPQNWKKIKKNWTRLIGKYRSETQKTRIHIIIHAIHAHILEKFFSKEELQKETKAVRNRDYIRFWKIVTQEGYENIIKGLIKKVRNY